MIIINKCLPWWRVAQLPKSKSSSPARPCLGKRVSSTGRVCITSWLKRDNVTLFYIEAPDIGDFDSENKKIHVVGVNKQWNGIWNSCNKFGDGKPWAPWAPAFMCISCIHL